MHRRRNASCCLLVEELEDHTLDEPAREKIVHDLRRNSLLLEQHTKISRNGQVLVRRLVHGSADVKELSIPAVGLSAGSRTIAACFPPHLGRSDVEVDVMFGVLFVCWLIISEME